jgi:hypothetical protein
LRVWWQVANFVEKNYASIGCFEEAGVIRMSTRKTTAQVPEQLANSDITITILRAVDANERLVRAVAHEVTSFCEQFFADPTFSSDQDRLIKAGKLLQFLKAILEPRASSQQFNGSIGPPLLD